MLVVGDGHPLAADILEFAVVLFLSVFYFPIYPFQSILLMLQLLLEGLNRFLVLGLQLLLGPLVSCMSLSSRIHVSVE